MLKALRKKGVAKRIFIVLAIVIVPAFVLWGSASLLRSQKASYAGKIFGRKVSFDEFQESLRAVRTQAILQFGENFYKIERYLNLELEAWDRLILLQEAQKRKIRVSDKGVIDEIEKIPFFQKNDKFDEKLYLNILDYVFRTPPRFFEEQTRQRLRITKLFNQITDKISVGEEELLAAYQKENEKVKASYIFIPVANFEKEIALNDEEVKKYFTDHRQNFKEPPTINIQYLGFTYPKDAKEENKQELRNKVKEAYLLLQKGEALEKITQKNNIEIKETGFFSFEQALPAGVPLEVLQVAFGLEGDKFSNPVLASVGCFIVRIKEKKDAYLPDFPEAKPKVEKVMRQEKARQQALEKAQQLHDKINGKIKDFSSRAVEFGFKVQETPLFKLGEYLSNVGPSVEFQNAAFNLRDKDKISEVISTPQGFYILRLEEFVPIDQEKFKNEKVQFKERLLEQKQKEFFNKFFEDLKKKANLQDNISKMKLY